MVSGLTLKTKTGHKNIPDLEPEETARIKF